MEVEDFDLSGQLGTVGELGELVVAHVERDERDEASKGWHRSEVVARECEFEWLGVYVEEKILVEIG